MESVFPVLQNKHIKIWHKYPSYPSLSRDVTTSQKKATQRAPKCKECNILTKSRKKD